jgi:hypothetical protein
MAPKALCTCPWWTHPRDTSSKISDGRLVN